WGARGRPFKSDHPEPGQRGEMRSWVQVPVPRFVTDEGKRSSCFPQPKGSGTKEYINLSLHIA
ncbi:MAG: hypothetical protein ABIC57_00975, partial [bacterium]